MLHRDYILEVIEQFVDTVMRALRHALKEQDVTSAQEAEQAVADLLDLDRTVALELSPDSLVTMMLLSGMADSVADYVAYALDKLGDVYDATGDKALAELRRQQAEAVAESFGCDLSVVPQGLEGLEA